MLSTSDARSESFEAFVRVRWGPAVRMAYGLTLDRSAAEDMAQEAFARVWPRWARIEAQNPVGYLNRTIVNLAHSARRRRARATALQQAAASGVTDDGSVAVVERDAILRALGKLSRQQRAVLVLRYVEDIPIEEVASMLNCSTGAVKTHASRGVDMMRRHLRASVLQEEI